MGVDSDGSDESRRLLDGGRGPFWERDTFFVTCQHMSGDRYRAYSKLPARRGTVVERRSLTGELSLSCARPAADG